VRRLHCAEGHRCRVALTVEGQAECENILHQLIAVRAALREVNRLLQARYPRLSILYAGPFAAGCMAQFLAAQVEHFLKETDSVACQELIRER
jgi:hypothetical protein